MDNPTTKEKNLAGKQSSNTAIVTQENELVKFDPEQDIKQGQKAAKALMKVVEITKPLKLNGKTYLYFEHWQTMAKFFRMTVGTDWVKQITETDGNQIAVKGYEAKAVVYQNGVIVGSAEASCMRDEANWKTKPEFQLKSMAQTRAMGKALRSILGYIPVLAGIEATPAEEMDNGPLQPQSPRYGQNLTDKEPLKVNTYQQEPKIDLLGKDYDRYAEKIQNSTNLKELEAWAQNIKFLGKTLTKHEKDMLRDVYKKRLAGLMAMEQGEIIIGEDTPA